MTARGYFESIFGTGASITVPYDANVEYIVDLTDLPVPTGIELYVNGKMINSSTWNSGVSYEYRYPIKLASGNYTFYAKVFFKSHSPVTTNTGKLTVMASKNTSALTISKPESQSNTAFVSTASSSPTNVSLPTVSPYMKYLIPIGIIGAIGTLGYYLYKH